MWYTHVVEWYLAMKDEAMIPATTWMNIKNILSEISQRENDKYLNASTYINYLEQANS